MRALRTSLLAGVAMTLATPAWAVEFASDLQAPNYGQVAVGISQLPTPSPGRDRQAVPLVLQATLGRRVAVHWPLDTDRFMVGLEGQLAYGGYQRFVVAGETIQAHLGGISALAVLQGFLNPLLALQAKVGPTLEYQQRLADQHQFAPSVSAGLGVAVYTTARTQLTVNVLHTFGHQNPTPLSSTPWRWTQTTVGITRLF